MESRLKSYSILIVLLMLAAWPGSISAEQKCIPAGLPGSDETRTGLALQKSDVHDIQSVLGPTLVFRVDLTSEVSRMCYTSPFDYSLIAFELRHGVIIQILVMADKHRYGRWDWCTETPLSTNDLSLANGVSIGLSPSGAKDILGAPDRLDRDRWHYQFGISRPNAQITIQPRQDQQYQIENIELEFTDSRLIRFGIRVEQSRIMQSEICP